MIKKQMAQKSNKKYTDNVYLKLYTSQFRASQI
jgi:hypothetical protein